MYEQINSVCSHLVLPLLLGIMVIFYFVVPPGVFRERFLILILEICLGEFMEMAVIQVYADFNQSLCARLRWFLVDLMMSISADGNRFFKCLMCNNCDLSRALSVKYSVIVSI